MTPPNTIDGRLLLNGKPMHFVVMFQGRAIDLEIEEGRHSEKGGIIGHPAASYHEDMTDCLPNAIRKDPFLSHVISVDNFERTLPNYANREKIITGVKAMLHYSNE